MYLHTQDGCVPLPRLPSLPPQTLCPRPLLLHSILEQLPLLHLVLSLPSLPSTALPCSSPSSPAPPRPRHFLQELVRTVTALYRRLLEEQEKEKKEQKKEKKKEEKKEEKKEKR